MPSAWTLLCASLYARLHIDRSSSGASWNQTFGGAISVDAIEADLGGYPEDAHVVLHVTHTFVPEQCNATVGRGSAVGVYYTCSIADDSEASKDRRGMRIIRAYGCKKLASHAGLAKVLLLLFSK